MAKKKLEYKDVLNYEPSEYQRKIFDFVVHGTGNAVIKARAGSGKTATIIASMKLVPTKKKCLFLAFNTSVREEIEKKLVGYTNCKVKTVHGLGYSIIIANSSKKPEVDDFKYSTYLRRNLNKVSTVEIEGENDIIDYCDRIIQLLKFSRLNLAQSKREVKRIAEYYSIPIQYDEEDVVVKLMEWGKNNKSTVDYTDMVWLPYECDMNPMNNKYDWIFNDEAQDYSVAYVKLFMRCFKRGTRFVSCGDEFQSINQFAGASATAFNDMINHKNTQVFQLPISYRCDRKIIDIANQFVDDIIARPDAGLGIVKQETRVSEINGKDLVLCRTNAPLFKMYAKLIDREIPCYIKGKAEDRDHLISIVERNSVGESLGKTLEVDGLFPRLYDQMINERNRLIMSGLYNDDAIESPSVQSRYDTIVSLLTIAKDCQTKTELIGKIRKIYDKDPDGVCLSTVHKAKGLEADNVHIICRSLMPMKNAKNDMEMQQERNLQYVAVTRPKHKLCYVSEKEFPPTMAIDNNSDAITEFNYIETKVCALYNKPTFVTIDNIEMAKFRLSVATKVDAIHKNDNRKVVGDTNTTAIWRRKAMMDQLLSK